MKTPTGYYRTCGPAGEQEWVAVVADRQVWPEYPGGHVVVESGGHLTIAAPLTCQSVTVHMGGTITLADPAMSSGVGRSDGSLPGYSSSLRGVMLDHLLADLRETHARLCAEEDERAKQEEQP